MILTQSLKAQTLPLGIRVYKSQYTMSIPLIMAFLILCSLPIILLYIFGQDKLVKGMMAGAVKG
jgi:raffinose/stachyose/melibiose transport system permease protein